MPGAARGDGLQGAGAMARPVRAQPCNRVRYRPLHAEDLDILRLLNGELTPRAQLLREIMQRPPIDFGPVPLAHHVEIRGPQAERLAVLPAIGLEQIRSR